MTIAGVLLVAEALAVAFTLGFFAWAASTVIFAEVRKIIREELDREPEESKDDAYYSDPKF
jgi:hypothetical protein